MSASGQQPRLVPVASLLPQPFGRRLLGNVLGLKPCVARLLSSQRLERGRFSPPLALGRGQQATQRPSVWTPGATPPGFGCQPHGSLFCLSFLGGFSKDDGDGRGELQLWAEAQR